MNNKKNKDNLAIQTNYEISELNLKPLLNIFIRNKKTISIFAILGILFSSFFALLSKKQWEGQFQIVLRKESNNLLGNILGGEDQLSNLIGLESMDRKSPSLKTELEILKSPSVLMPVFDFVKNEKIKKDPNSNNLKFDKWQDSLDFDLKKRTSVMELKYIDNRKDLILPALKKIAKTYQEYSGRSRKRNIEITAKYLQEQIDIYKIKSSDSLNKAQEFAINNQLMFNQFNPLQIKAIQTKDEIASDLINKVNMGSLIGIEEIRVNAANKIRNIDLQIKKIESLDNDYEQLQYIGATIPGLNETGLPAQLELIQSQISNLGAKYTKQDIAIKRLLDQRIILIKLLKNRAVGYLRAEKLATEALMEAAMRPKVVLTKYRELIREAARDEKTLEELENKFNIIKLERARIEDPWELITEPTLIPSPVEPKVKNIIIIGFIFSLFIGYLLSLFLERKKGNIYEEDLLEEKLDSIILDVVNLENNTYKVFSKEIIQKEILDLNTYKIKIIISNSLKRNNPKEILKTIFSNSNQYEEVITFNQVGIKDKIIFLAKLSDLKINEIESMKTRLDLNGKKLFGIILFI